MNRPPHILLVEAPYYTHIADQLRKGAERALAAAGATHEIISVPGAFEIPAAIGLVARASDRFDGFVALGCVIRGETTHYEIVSGECARGVQDVQLSTRVPVAFGVLTVNTLEQALERSANDEDNKGREAATTVLEMVSVLRQGSLGT